MPPKYSDVHVRLMRHDQGEYGPLARCLGAMTRAGIPPLERERFTERANAGDYAALLRVAGEWLVVAGGSVAFADAICILD